MDRRPDGKGDPTYDREPGMLYVVDTSGKLEGRVMGHAIRGVAFVLLNVGMVAAFCYALGRALPPLRNEPPALLLQPITVISALVFAILYPALARQPRRAAQAATLYAAFVVSLVAYGVYLWVMIPDGSVGLVILSLLAGHFYGFPLYFTALGVTFLFIRPHSQKMQRA